MAGGRSASSQARAHMAVRRLTDLLPVLLLCDSRSAVTRAGVYKDDRHHRKPVVGARSPSRRAGHQGSITRSWPHPRRLTIWERTAGYVPDVSCTVPRLGSHENFEMLHQGTVISLIDQNCQMVISELLIIFLTHPIGLHIVSSDTISRRKGL